LRRKSAKKQKKVRRVKEAFVVPGWFRSLPLGSHGSTPAQKKYWKVISDTYREEDWYDHHGKCVSCDRKLEHWRDGDLGHYKAWSVCNSWFKYERKNLALQCKGCNRLSDGTVGTRFGKELQRRYGNPILSWIDKENQKYTGQKMEVWQIVECVKTLRPDLTHGK
jgi:hypothetical protein